MIYGYCRVSSKEQNVDRQLKLLKQYKVDEIFIDIQTGGNYNRTGIMKLIKKLNYNDVVVICELDRLGRNYNENINYYFKITKEKNANIIVINDDILNKKPQNLEENFLRDLHFIQTCYIAEKELNNIKARQMTGIEAMQIVNGKRIGKTGRPTGRPKKDLPSNYKYIVGKQKSGTISISEACRQLNISRVTYYKLFAKEQNNE